MRGCRGKGLMGNDTLCPILQAELPALLDGVSAATRCCGEDWVCVLYRLIGGLLDR